MTQSERPVEERPLYRGLCFDGPLHGKEATSRKPKGFILVDRPNRKTWIYDFGHQGFVCRDPAGARTSYSKRWDAAMGDDYDVQVMP